MFHFRLTTLLKLRLQDRDQRRGELAQAVEAEQILREQRTAIETERQATRERVRQAAEPGHANVDLLMEADRYGLLLQAQLAGLNKQIAQLAAEVERRRLVLVDADRQVRILEKLREKQQGVYNLAVDAAERKALDELALVGHVRKRARQEANP